MRKAAILNWLVYWFVRRRRLHPAAIRWPVGIYKVDRLGDFILSIEAIRIIVATAGEANCVLIHSVVSSQIAAREFPNVSRIALPPLDGKLWVTYRRLRRLIADGFDSGGIGGLICLRHYRTLSDEIALQMIPAAKVWCVRNSHISDVGYELVADRFQGDIVVDRPVSVARQDLCEDLVCHQSIVSAWSKEPSSKRDIRPRLRPHRGDLGNTLALVPFGSDRLRDLPVAGVVACVVHAREKLGLNAVLLSPPGAVPRYSSYIDELRSHGAAVALRITQDCNELIDAIGNSTVLLTAETATAHIAAALDIPMVCLVGGGHFGLFGPWRWSSRQQWVTNRVRCFNCGWQCIYPEPICIKGVASEKLVEALEEAVNGQPTEFLQASV